MKLLTAYFTLLTASLHAADWQPIDVPGNWESQIGDHDGFGWYRCFVEVPQDWEGSRLLLTIRATDNVDESFFNGDKVGANGALPPLYNNPSSDVRRPAVIDPDQVRFGEMNLVAFRVYDHDGEGGLVKGPIQLSRLEDAIDLSGTWDFITGDQQEYAHWPNQDPTSKAALSLITEYQARHPDQPAGHRGVVPADVEGRESDMALVRKRFEGNTNVHSNIEGKGAALSPQDALAALQAGSDFAIDTVLHEPTVTQPLYVEFDARGRLWVCQYIQYPKPAGLNVLTWDNHLRSVFDSVPPPPPYDKPEHQKFIGRDKITIHEDTNGDGTFDSHKTFAEGLNIVTSTCQGKDGVWVMNPPYLLFYPDRDHNDVPDAAPTVHLSGFGLEDTHSVANSIKWGPDGWLYGCTGSTVTARVRVASRPDQEALQFFGQNIWRYHPDTHDFELFAEGGWNTFGVDFDSKGRLYSGTNGSMQAVHFVQDGFYQKGFGKHGPHTNPHAFDYFHGVPIEGKHPRLVQQWVPYDGGAWPTHQGSFIGVNCLDNSVPIISLTADGSTFKSRETESGITSKDIWFRPVHATTGPDGNLYISDFYDARITHVDPRDNWDRDHGRIYRLRHAQGTPHAPLGDLRQKSGDELIALLDHPNQWHRWTARRILVEAKDPFLIHPLKERLRGSGQGALEALWTLHGFHQLNEPTALEALAHPDVHVRLWTVRLLGDRKEGLSPDLLTAFQGLAQKDDPRLISQLASTIQRLPRTQALSLLNPILSSGKFSSDPFIPSQLWWALEKQLTRDPIRTIASLNTQIWNTPIAETKLARLTGRRLAADPTETNLQAAALLLGKVPRNQGLEVVRGMETSLQGIPLTNVPEELGTALTKMAAGDTVDIDLLKFAIRLNSDQAWKQALHIVRNPESRFRSEDRLALIQTVAEHPSPRITRLLLHQIQTDPDTNIKLAAVQGLRRATEPEIPDQLIALAAQSQDSPIKATILNVLTGRRAWAKQLLDSITSKKIAREALTIDQILVMQGNTDPTLNAQIDKLWGNLRQPNQDKQGRIAAITALVSADPGDPKAGQQIYQQRCAACHTLFDQGANIGPELTGYERSNLEFLVTAIVDPNLGVREEFELTTVTLRPRETNGEPTILSGFVKELTNSQITLQDLTGQTTPIATRDILQKQNSPVSIMPEGMLDSLTEEQIQNLFAYLQAPSAPPK